MDRCVFAITHCDQGLTRSRRLRTQITMPLEHLSHLIERVERMLDLSRSLCRAVELKCVCGVQIVRLKNISKSEN